MRSAQIRKLLPASLLVLLLAVSASAFLYLQHTQHQQLGKNLQTSLHAGLYALRNAQDQALLQVQQIARQPSALALVELSQDPSASQQQLAELRAQLNSAHALLNLMQPGFTGAFILFTPNRNVLAASRNRAEYHIDRVAELPEVQRLGWLGETFITPADITHHTQLTVVPIRNRAGETLALLASEIDLHFVFSSLLASLQYGETGEIYAFTDQAQLFSDSRFSDNRSDGNLSANHNELSSNPNLRQTTAELATASTAAAPLTLMAKSAINGNSDSNLDGYLNYRGQPVVGAWLWDRKLNFGLASEIETDEALALLHQQGLVIAALTILAALILLASVYSLGRNRKHHLKLFRQQAAILDHTRTFIYIRDLDGRVIYANREAINIFNIESSNKREILQRNITDREQLQHVNLLSPRQQYFIEVDDDILLKEKVAFNYQASLQINDKQVTYMVNKFPLRHANGVVYAIGTSGLDITSRLATEQKLKEKENFQTNLMASLPGAVYRCRLNKKLWVLEFISQGCLELYGHSSAALMREDGKLFREIVYPDDRARVDQQLRDALRLGKPYQIDYRLNQDGNLKWCLVRGHTFINGGNTITEGFISDITERKNAERELSAHRRQLTAMIADRTQELDRERQRLNDIINSAGDSIISFTSNFSITLFNPAAVNFFGLNESKVKDTHLRTLFDETNFEKLTQTISSLNNLHASNNTLEIDARHSNGNLISAEASISSNRAHGKVSFTLIVRDIGLRKEQRRLLQLAKQNAEEASKSKTQFLANISHEIRTPLNAIIGMNQLALRTQLSEKQQRYLKTIAYSSNTLLGLINDVLDFSKIETGKLSIEQISFNLETILEAISHNTSVRALERGVNFLLDIDTNVPTYLKGDPLRISQILSNLCSNATKFTEQGHIVLGVKCLPSTGAEIKLELFVEDTGIGMSPSQTSLLFNAFTQADNSSTRKHGGIGLGLTICQELVRLMGGEISVASELGKGSRFSCILNFLTADDQPVVSRSARANSLNLLVVEDDQTTADILTDSLRAMGHSATHCLSAEQAMACIASRTEFDAMLVDWQLPGMNGDEFIVHLKRTMTRKPSPVAIMITSRQEAEASDAARAAGADALLLKPITHSSLADALAQLCSDKPQQHLASDDTPTSFQPPYHLRGANLLIVEDNPINQEIASEIFENAGFNTSVAGNGKIAIEMLNNRRFDLVLMDLQMPVLDGESATKLLRADSKFSQLPIIAMTANSMLADKKRCKEIGMNAHIAKPVDVEAALSTVCFWLQKIDYGKQNTENRKAEITAKRPQKNANTATERDKLFSPGAEWPGLNWERGLVNCSRKPALYLRLLGDFAKNYHDFGNTVETLLASGNFHDAHHHTHSLKGVSGNLGAMRLSEACSILDSNIRQQSPDVAALKAQLFSLHKALDQLFVSLRKLGCL